MAFVPPARHLLKARDLADARYAEPLEVSDLAHAAGLSQAHFSREFRAAFGESPHQYLLTRRLERAAALAAHHRQLGGGDLLRGGPEQRRLVHHQLRRMFGMSPTAYRAEHPPAAAYALIPTCVLRTYGRPRNRTFREDSSAARN